MTYEDEGPTWVKLSDGWHRARKARPCASRCQRGITVGGLFRKTVGLVDGEFSQYEECEYCATGDPPPGSLAEAEEIVAFAAIQEQEAADYDADQEFARNYLAAHNDPTDPVWQHCRASLDRHG